jgi:glutathione S-transferase
MMIQVLGRNTSSNVQAVMWAIGELGLEFERLDVGHSFGGNDTADYLAMNPMGLIPVFKDSDLTMFESCAIVRYLGAQYGDDNFYPALLGPIFFPLVREDPANLDQAKLDQAVTNMNKLALIFDKTLQTGKFSDGQNLTFADVMVGHLLYRYYELDIDRPELPNLSQYYTALTERPAYREHVMVSWEPLRWKST